MSLRKLFVCLFLGLSLGCSDGVFRPVFNEQRLASGKTIKVTSCLLVWGVEHDERDKKKDSFALEYVTSFPPTAGDELDKEALEAFELIRPVSEQWGFTMASVAAFGSVERTGKYNAWNFSRESGGPWSFKRESAKVYNTESGDKE